MLPGQHFAEHAGPGQDGGLRILFRRGRQQAAENRIAEVILQHMTAQLREVGGLEITRPPAGDPGVQRHHNGLVAGVFRPRDQALRQLAVLRRVELEIGRHIAAMPDHLFQRVIGQG